MLPVGRIRRLRRIRQPCRLDSDYHFAVIAAQGFLGLPQTGVVDETTWDEIYDQFAGIETSAFRDPEDFPYTSAILGQTQPRNRHSRSTTVTQFPGTDLSPGNQDPVRQEVVR